MLVLTEGAPYHGSNGRLASARLNLSPAGRSLSQPLGVPAHLSVSANV